MTETPAASAVSTKERLVAAAGLEFNERGFEGTDSNRIARRAGFAPQTFYRWFKDKTEIFLAVYRAWEEEERRFVGDLVRRQAGGAAVIEAAVRHHRDHLRFRRSLRRLAVEDPVVRQARAESRLRQVERIRRGGAHALSTDAVAVRLLQLERLSDALAEGELADMGLDESVAQARLVALLAELSGD